MLTTPDLTSLQRLGQHIGGATFLVGLSLATPSNDSDVVQFTAVVEKGLQEALDAFIIGNVGKLDLIFLGLILT